MDDALRRYHEDRFTDEDMTRCTGLSVRAWRELIKLGAVRTVTERQGPGRVRRCDSTTLKRAAAISALNQAGLSLFVSSQVAFFLPLHTILYEICDPCRILLENSTDVDPLTGLPPRVQRPRVSWFDPDKPAVFDPNADWLVEIYEFRFVAIKYSVNGAPTIFGDLREAGTSFIGWFPNDARAQFNGGIIAELAEERLPSGARLIDAVVAWEDPRPLVQGLASARLQNRAARQERRSATASCGGHRSQSRPYDHDQHQLGDQENLAPISGHRTRGPGK